MRRGAIGSAPDVLSDDKLFIETLPMIDARNFRCALTRAPTTFCSICWTSCGVSTSIIPTRRRPSRRSRSQIDRTANRLMADTLWVLPIGASPHHPSNRGVPPPPIHARYSHGAVSLPDIRFRNEVVTPVAATLLDLQITLHQVRNGYARRIGGAGQRRKR